jgi:hypothetical protein
MNSAPPLAIVVDSDVGVLSQTIRLLGNARYQALGRLSPRGLMSVLKTLQPELLLLGRSFWQQGWGPLLRQASPETVVFPIGEADPETGTLDAARLSSLLRGAAATEPQAA